MAGYGLSIAATQLTIAGSVEVQAVGAVRTVVRRNHLTSVNRLRQFVNLLLTTDADTLAAGLNDVSHIEVHLFGFQLQVTAKVLIHLLHHAGPLRVASISLALVHQNTLDDTIFLGLLGQFHQTLVGIVVVGGQHTLHPARSLLLGIFLDAVGQEALDVDTTNSHMDNTNLDVVGQ